MAEEFFLGEARDILQHTANAVVKARAGVATQAEIKVGYAPSLTVQILPVMLRAFQREIPHVRVTLHDLSSEEMFEQLGNKKLHVALTVRPSAKMLRGLSFVEMARYAVVVAVAPNHPLAKSKAITLQQGPEPLIGLNRKDYPDSYVEIIRLFAAVGLKPHFAE